MASNSERPTQWPWGTNWLELEQVPEPYRTFLRQVQEFADSLLKKPEIWIKNPPPKLVQTHHGMIANFELNAEAKRARLGLYAIALDGGAPIQLWDTFQRLLSNPMVLPDIGKTPQDYSGKPALMKFGPVSCAEGFKQLTEGDHSQPPLGDAERISVLKLLIHRSLQFMYLHELFHVLGGHCDYLKDSLEPPPKRILRAFEHIADTRATLLALMFETLAIHEQGEKFPRLKTDGYRLWGFSIATWYHLVEVFEDQSSHGAERRYPRATLRSLIANACPAGGQEDYVTTTNRKVLELISVGFKEAHDAWEALGWGQGTEVTEEEFDQAFLEINEAEMLIKSLNSAK